jgi:nucleoid-associated protein YgaU
MSEAAPEPGGRGGGGIGGTLGRKAGPLPVWGWLVILTVAAAGYYLWKNRGSASSSAVTGTGSVTPASSVPDYVSQTTVNLTEPPEPGTTGDGGGGKPPAGKPPARKPPARRPGGKPPARKPGGGGDTDPVFSGSYTVKPGDTLKKLAEKYGVDLTDLAHANGLGTGAGLRTGQVLKVPGPVRTRAEGGPG